AEVIAVRPIQNIEAVDDQRPMRGRRNEQYLKWMIHWIRIDHIEHPVGFAGGFHDGDGLIVRDGNGVRGVNPQEDLTFATPGLAIEKSETEIVAEVFTWLRRIEEIRPYDCDGSMNRGAHKLRGKRVTIRVKADHVPVVSTACLNGPVPIRGRFRRVVYVGHDDCHMRLITPFRIGGIVSELIGPDKIRLRDVKD